MEEKKEEVKKVELIEEIKPKSTIVRSTGKSASANQNEEPQPQIYKSKTEGYEPNEPINYSRGQHYERRDMRRGRYSRGSGYNKYEVLGDHYY